MKLCQVSGTGGIWTAPFQGGSGVLSDTFEIWYSSGTIHLTDYGSYYFTSAEKFRDPSAWYHLVIRCDTTQASAVNRIRLYMNGLQLTNTAATSITQNLDTAINSNVPHRIADWRATYSNLYLAEIQHVDGQSLDPTSFGEFSTTTGVWMPKAYTGTYGTNGFHLDFSNNASAAALGTDVSGNGNTWTVNNLSVTAGAGNDSLVDVPTNGSEVDTGAGGQVRGNYCTWNPLASSANPTIRNGNLDILFSVAGTVLGSIGITSGKWYWEITISDTNPMIGLVKQGCNLASYPGSDSLGWGYSTADGYKYNAAGGTSYGATATIGDVIGVAFDADAGTLVYYKNNVSQGTAFTALTSGPYFPAVGRANGAPSIVANFGQRPFAYTAPSGFKALCTANLPAPVVTKPSTVFDTYLWSGNGGTQTISTSFSPDFVWVKQRDNTNVASHVLVDIVRGNNNVLRTNGTDAENGAAIDPALYDGITNLSTASFDVVKGSSGTYNGTNGSGKSYVGWTWDAGSSTVTDNTGSIQSSRRTNASAGISIVSYTGTGSNATIGHGLGVAPALIIAKARTAAEHWQVGHTSIGWGARLFLSTTNATDTTSAAWNNTAPTSTVFSVGNSGNINNNGTTYVAYCFAPVAGYSAFGSYTGNGSADGPFVFCNFRPRWIMVKSSSYSNNTVAYSWCVLDTQRNTSNVMTSLLLPNASDSEYTVSAIDALSNGFKLRDANSSRNESGVTYVYAAFAESPFQYARAR
jgi:hypothetical protein